MRQSQKNSRLIELIRARRAQKGRRGLRRRPPRWLYPVALERQYTRKLLSDLYALEDQIIEKLYNRLPALVAQAKISLDSRQDDFVDDIRAIMAALGVTAGTIFGQAEDYALGMALQISNFNGAQYARIIRSTLGVDPIGGDEFLQSRLKAFAKQNASLITSIPDRLLQDVEGVVIRGLTGGATVRDMQAEIRARFKVTRARAKLIARDQTSKLNAQLTEVRQTRIGIEEYTWESADDERVRENHKVLDGMVCRWDDDTVYREPGSDVWLKRASIGGYIGHPGTDYQCRCWPTAHVEDLINGSK